MSTLDCAHRVTGLSAVAALVDLAGPLWLAGDQSRRG